MGGGSVHLNNPDVPSIIFKVPSLIYSQSELQMCSVVTSETPPRVVGVLVTGTSGDGRGAVDVC